MRLVIVFLSLISLSVMASNNAKVVITGSSVNSVETNATLIKPTNTLVIPRHQDSIDTWNYWVHSTWLTLQNDWDFDGFASSFLLDIDIDTQFNEALIYTIIYLGTDNRFESIHVSEDFYLFGNSSNDILNLDIQLVSGYQPADYDILIEVYDAYSGQLLTYVDNTHFSDLSFQPLESEDFEDTSGSVTVTETYGGAMGSKYALAILLLFVGIKLKRQNKEKPFH